MKARYPIPDHADTWEMVKQVIDMDLEIRIENWMGPACTVLDELHPQKGCAQLRGEGAGETFEEALRDACNQAINHLHPADPDHDEQE